MSEYSSGFVLAEPYFVYLYVCLFDMGRLRIFSSVSFSILFIQVMLTVIPSARPDRSCG